MAHPRITVFHTLFTHLFTDLNECNILTINAEIRADGKRANGTYNVKLRFTLDRKKRRLATSFFATPKDLTKDLKIKSSSPVKQEVDNLIRSYQERCAKLQIELNNYTIDDVMDFLDGEHQKQKAIDFIKFSREWIASTTIKGAPNYTTAINALIRFIGKEELDEIAAPPTRDGFVFPDILKGAEKEELRRKYTVQENSNVKDRVIKVCHEALNWDKSICPSGTWCRHSFATNLHNAGVDMDYISESMGHASSDHAITQIYIEHYPLDIHMQNNSKLLNLDNSSERDVLLAKLASMSTEELLKLFR